MQTQAIITTKQALAYIDELCAHFIEAHALEVRRPTAESAHVALPGQGDCTLLAQPDSLVVTLQAPPENRFALEQFLASHIGRLPQGRTLSVIWQATAGEAV